MEATPKDNQAIRRAQAAHYLRRAFLLLLPDINSTDDEINEVVTEAAVLIEDEAEQSGRKTPFAPILEDRNCQDCGDSFSFDRYFFLNRDLHLPKRCPRCRERRRLEWQR